MNSNENKYVVKPITVRGFERIKHDIRNFKHMTNEQMTIILSLSNEQKNEILLLYNEVVEQMQALMENL